METELPFSSPGEIISFKTEINELLSGFKNPKISNVLSDILSLTLSEGNLEPLVPFPRMKLKVMGVYLSSPKTEKFSEDGGNDRVKYGLSSMQGWRATMEDAHAAIPDLDSSTSFFGVYDGHGDDVANFDNFLCRSCDDEPMESNKSPVAGDETFRHGVHSLFELWSSAFQLSLAYSLS
ncbi:putative protein phosphatase 2C 60 [Capsicum baccatum]|uniref:protein-serine/threonine phosphatase n=1 Tax=Capsicum baccatum TaxID=33114 RepID=A0A2G2UWN9_CAPBA|nr:putative protein phosphatase 2C 60 [Capsicum baccatum]